MSREVQAMGPESYESLTLDELAERLNAGHDAALHGMRDSAMRVYQNGAMLIAAKGKCKHGEWLPWLATKCPEISEDSAHRYMKTYRNSAKMRNLDLADLSPTEAYKALGVIPGNVTTGNKHVSTGEVEWYTPVDVIDAAREVMGGISTDPASSDMAQETVQADTYYTKDDDGLNKPWFGSVFLNPPYSAKEAAAFAARAVSAIESKECEQIIVLTNNSSDTDWFQSLCKACDLVCFTDGRVRFYNSDGETLAARQGQTIFYSGPNKAGFIQKFQPAGIIFRKA